MLTPLATEVKGSVATGVDTALAEGVVGGAYVEDAALTGSTGTAAVAAAIVDGAVVDAPSDFGAETVRARPFDLETASGEYC